MHIGKSLILDKYCKNNCLPTGEKFLTATDANSSFSFLKQPCRKTYPVNMVISLLEKGQIINMHQAWKTLKEITETTKTGLRTVHYLKIK